jgi:hypothetical protein
MDSFSRQPAAKKALVVVGDGLNSSGSSSGIPLPRALIEASKTSAFPIHFLFLTTSLSAPGFSEGSSYATGYYLEQIAEFSGGRVFIGQIENDLTRVSGTLRDSLKSGYVLGYRSPNTAKDGKWRKLSVKIVNPPAGVSKPKVTAKERYFVAKAGN